MGAAGKWAKEIRRTLANPGRIASIRDTAKLRAFLWSLAPVRQRGRWADGEGLRTRRYRSYDAYVRHQRSKLKRLDWLDTYDVQYREALRRRLTDGGLISGGAVLCLAARLGTEVKAFHDLGCFAVGIDLNPGKDNPYVLVGDFHALTFPADSVDAVFTNSMDHSPDPHRLIAEATRVLKPGGLFILEAMKGYAEGSQPGAFEAAHWDSVDDLLALFDGYTVIHRSDFVYPWAGEHVILRHG